MSNSNDKNCAQVVLSAFSEDYGLSEDMACALAAGFGGGRFKGDTCGCVNAATMILGLAFKDDEEKRLRASTRFEDAFTKENGSILCREILGYDFSKPGEMEKALSEGVINRHCPKCIETSIAILKEELAK